MDHLKLSSLAISEINFLHESFFGAIGHSWFLLLGFKQDQDDGIYMPTNNNEAESQWYVEKVIRIPVQGNDQINQESLKRRIDLTKVTQKDICILGILDLFQLEEDKENSIEVTEKILTQLVSLELTYFIRYDIPYPQVPSQKTINKLTGFQIQNKVQLGREIILEFLQDKVEIDDMNDRYQIFTPDNDMGLNCDEFQLVDMKEKENNIQEYNNNTVTKLVKRINRMIKFLEKYDTREEAFSAGRDVILRNISMLVTQLQRGGTSDMNYLLNNKINEIKLLEISCKQWEISNTLKK
ncbi:csi1p [Saccharomyces arboricola H-6]|uniref:Csi1p n=1 Tax=Saccharomyces arboricola (strain H-6 / AS 2.3317 / CBS 10644) TaxID=1160507 RepID=J8PYJ4_SACAR|nr:csi1p [Saccharomyces arboricola H-6]